MSEETINNSEDITYLPDGTTSVISDDSVTFLCTSSIELIQERIKAYLDSYVCSFEFIEELVWNVLYTPELKHCEFIVNARAESESQYSIGFKIIDQSEKPEQRLFHEFICQLKSLLSSPPNVNTFDLVNDYIDDCVDVCVEEELEAIKEITNNDTEVAKRLFNLTYQDLTGNFYQINSKWIVDCIFALARNNDIHICRYAIFSLERFSQANIVAKMIIRDPDMISFLCDIAIDGDYRTHQMRKSAATAIHNICTDVFQYTNELEKTSFRTSCVTQLERLGLWRLSHSNDPVIICMKTQMTL
jgi:hypothetical protein